MKLSYLLPVIALVIVQLILPAIALYNNPFLATKRALNAKSIAISCTKEEEAQFDYGYQSEGLCYRIINQEIALKRLDNKLSKYILRTDWVRDGSNSYHKTWNTELGDFVFSLDRRENGNFAIFTANHMCCYK